MVSCRLNMELLNINNTIACTLYCAQQRVSACAPRFAAVLGLALKGGSAHRDKRGVAYTRHVR